MPSPAAFVGGPQAEARKLEQAHLVFMLPACGAREDDYFALRIFAECLGGGMSSRLFQEAREKLPSGISPSMGPISTGLGEIYLWTVEAEEGAKKPDGTPYNRREVELIQGFHYLEANR